jgi:glycosyltransferase involved in cell wall biosynthesis
VLNGEQHIRACIESILNQSYDNFEIVVSIDVSQDLSTEIVRSFTDPRIHLLPELTERLSLHANWARALAGARGDMIKIVCQDDLIFPDCLSVQTELLQRYPEAIIASGRRCIINDRGKVLIRARGLEGLTGLSGTKKVSASEVARACIRAGTNLLGEPASVLIRRSALPNPPFNARWRYTIDIEFYMRCLKNGDAIADDRVLCYFRASHKQLSATMVNDQLGELRAFFTEMMLQYPEVVTTADVRRGAIRAQLLTIARRVLYAQMRLGAAYISWLRRGRLRRSSTSKGL